MTDVSTVRVGPEQTTVVVTETSQTVVREVPATDVIAAAQIGPVGPRGDVGPPGPQGTGSGFEHVQTVPSAVWTVQHNLGHPIGGMTVLDTDGELILGWTVTQASLNVLVFTFPSAQSGIAYVS